MKYMMFLQICNYHLPVTMNSVRSIRITAFGVFSRNKNIFFAIVVVAFAYTQMNLSIHAVQYNTTFTAHRFIYYSEYKSQEWLLYSINKMVSSIILYYNQYKIQAWLLNKINEIIPSFMLYDSYIIVNIKTKHDCFTA